MPLIDIAGFSLTALVVISLFGLCLYTCFECYTQRFAEGDLIGRENGETTAPVDPEELNGRIQTAMEKLTKPSTEYDYENVEAPSEFNACAICLEEFEDGDSSRVFPNCEHMFHMNCIFGWLGINQTCPICRTQL